MQAHCNPGLCSSVGFPANNVLNIRYKPTTICSRNMRWTLPLNGWVEPEWEELHPATTSEKRIRDRVAPPVQPTNCVLHVVARGMEKFLTKQTMLILSQCKQPGYIIPLEWLLWTTHAAVVQLDIETSTHPGNDWAVGSVNVGYCGG